MTPEQLAQLQADLEKALATIEGLKTRIEAFEGALGKARGLVNAVLSILPTIPA